MLSCPRCRSEVAYAPLSEALVCLTPACNWQEELTEDEVFELFFESVEVAACA